MSVIRIIRAIFKTLYHYFKPVKRSKRTQIDAYVLLRKLYNFCTWKSNFGGFGGVVRGHSYDL